MYRREKQLGIFGALAVVLTLLGLIALFLNFIGMLPKY